MTNKTELTAPDVKRMRSALRSGECNAIVFRTEQDGGAQSTAMEFCMEVKRNGERVGDYREYFAVDARAETYSATRNGWTSCVTSQRVYTFKGDDVASILSNVIRAGDVIRVNWMIDNGTDTLRAAGLEHDTCTAAIWRGDKCVASILVADVIAPYGPHHALMARV